VSPFARVCADPDDDVAREILADALQERGDPHGTLIALQMRLGHLGPDEDDERERLTEEVEVHLAEHGEALDLAWNEGIGEPGCLALAASGSFGRLRMLDLHEVRTGRAGGRALRTRFGQAVVR
jgi:uncharacterized protein (TIGR02996 family)